MKIAVGSENPVKIKSVERAFKEYYSGIEVVGIPAISGVSDQPMMQEESFTGAKNRAEFALKTADADFGVGIEGGIEKYPFGAFTSGWVVIIDRKGTIGIGTSTRLLVPKKIYEQVKTGNTEIGKVMDSLTGLSDLKHHEGMTGVFTKGVITREESYYKAVIIALTRFVCPELYE